MSTGGPAGAANHGARPVHAGAGGVRLEGIVKRHGTTTVLHDIDLAIAPGEFFVLLGPSGSGKTTTLRILAGLESVSAGRVIMDGADVTTRPPGERDVAMVFQSYALYPHMTVAGNIGFPLRMVGTPRADVERAVAAAALKVGIGHLLHRTPGQLSGGQQQRCALARAIVRQPRLFLLDEPLSNLDAKLRVQTRLELHRLQRSLGVTAVYVTHDQEEAMTLADRFAVFIDGRIVQVGTPREVYATPATAEVAAFIGTPPMNLVPARWEGEAVVVLDQRLPVGRAGDGRAVTLGIRPADLRIAGQGIPAIVERIEDLGDSAIVSFVAGDRILQQKSEQQGALREGEHVHLAFDPPAAQLFDAATGARL